MRVSILFSTAVFAFVLAGCDTLECGLGTMRIDGVCVAGDNTPVDCGPGFAWDSSSGLCRPAFDAAWGVCGNNTALEVNDAGGAVREIGFDTKGNPIVLGPIGRNFGFITDSSDDWSASEGESEETARHFERRWSTALASFQHLASRAEPWQEPPGGCS